MKTIVSILFLCICLHTNLNAENNQKDITAIATSFNDDHFKLTLHNFPRNELVSISMQRKAIGEDKFRDVMKFQVTDRRFNVFDVSGKQLAVKEELLLPKSNICPGEEIALEFKDSSGKLLEQLVYTPNPISKLSKNESFSIQARLVYDNPTLYLLTFDGFTDQEEQVHFISKTENMAKSKQEANNMEIKVQKGFMIPYMPGIVNEDGGEATVYFKRTSGDSLRLNLKWGAKIMTSMM